MSNASNRKLKCAIYARVSTEKQRECHTIASQVRILPEYAEKQGWEIADKYIDDGYSGETIEGRPEFSRLLDDATRGRFEILLVIDEDRISRSKSGVVGAFIYDTLRENNVKIATSSGTFVDLSNEDQDFFAALKREVAKWEKRKILSRMRRGRLEKWKQGRLLSKRPYGYIYDKKLNVFEVHEEEAAVVRLIFDLCANKNFGLVAIAKELNSRGIEGAAASQGTNHKRYSSHWAKSSVFKVLNYIGYCGELAYNVRVTKQLTGKSFSHVVGIRPESEWIRISVPAIVDRETFNTAHLKLRQRKILSDKNKKREYLCGGMLYCSECGSKMCGECSHGRKSYYICYNRKKHHKSKSCSTPWMAVSNLDSAVWNEIESVIRNPKVLSDALVMARSDSGNGASSLSEQQLQRELERIGIEETRALRLYTKSKLSETKLDTVLEDIRREREGVQQKLGMIEKEREARKHAEHAAISLKSLAMQVSHLSFDRKREILKTFVDGTPGTGIFVGTNRSVKIVGAVPLPPQTTSPSSVQNASMLWPPAMATSIARLA